MSYWFLRMKQGSGGEDFTKELWQQGLVGVLFGTWGIKHVLDDKNKPDSNKLSANAIVQQCPQPEGMNKGKGFNDRFLSPARAFLIDIFVGDRVVVSFDKSIHIGTVDEGYIPDPAPPRGPFEEQFKCRPISNRKGFPLEDLPASYRLIPNIGQGAVQRIWSSEPLVKLLDQHSRATEIRQAILAKPTDEFLAMLSPQQWEVLCAEYLRSKIGFRALLLGIGGTLQDIDIYGIDNEACRVLAQCKNDPKPWSRNRLRGWIDKVPRGPEDCLYFFNRGGFKDGAGDNFDCRLVDGQAIIEWLQDDDDYFQHLKTL